MNLGRFAWREQVRLPIMQFVANRLMSIIDEIWVIHLQKVDTLLMIGI
jgi:hypothetical protein